MIYKLGAAIILAVLLLGAGYGYGKIVATKKYEPQLAEVRAALETVNQQGQLQIAKGKEALDATARQNESNIAAIRARYERMLRDAKSNINTSSTSASSSGTNGTGSEQSIVGCSIDFEQACILDANKVTQWQEWAKRNQIPIAE